MENTRLRFAAAVRAERAQAGWSQEELAERAGLHRTYVSGVERGLRNISIDNIDRIASALGIPISTLFLRVEGSPGA